MFIPFASSNQTEIVLIARACARMSLFAATAAASALALGWLPNLAPPTGCGVFGIAALFGAILLASPCTFRVGSIWTSATFSLAAVAALLTQQWLLVAGAATFALFAGLMFAVGEDTCPREVDVRPGKPAPYPR